MKYLTSQYLYENGPENYLSLEREKIISNQNLFLKGSQKELQRFLNSTPLHKDSWNPAGRFPKKPVQFSQYFKNKAISDTVEALIGFEYLKNGEKAALEMTIQLDILPRIRLETKDREIPPEMSTFAESMNSVQQTLGYIFQSPALLLDSIVHPTFGKLQNNFLRLAFLGDAVIEMIVVDYIQKEFPFLNSLEIHDLKSLGVSNEFLGRVCSF